MGASGMSVTGQRASRRAGAIAIGLAVGIPLVAVGLVIGLVALGIAAITAPRHFDLLKYGGTACSVSADRRSVYVELTLTERDDFPELAEAKLDQASNASLVQSGWLAPPLGFASGETPPSQAELRKAFAGSRYPRSLPSPRSNLILRIAVDPSQSSSVDAADLLFYNGEPAILQTLAFNLHAGNGDCAVEND